MAYRMVYLRTHTYEYASGWSNKDAETAFDEECRRLLQELGWTLHAGADGVCDTVTMGQQNLYLHPTSFSGVMDENNIQPLMEQLSEAKTFRCYAFDCYEEYADMSDNEYCSILESKREEIRSFILEQCRTKRTNLYITDPVAVYIAQHFEICRICDRDRNNAVGNRFVSELIEQLLQEGRLVTAETTHGPGIRTATSTELRHHSKPVEQVDGQITMVF